MKAKFSVKLALSLLVALVIGFSCVCNAAAASPAQAMSAHLYISGLPEGQLVTVTMAGHTQLNYYGGQGRYDFPIAGQPGETIRVLADGKDVQTLTFEPGNAVYLNLAYADGAVNAVPYDPSVPMPTPYTLPTIAPEPQTEHTGIGLDGSWIFVMATMMSLIVVGCFASVRRKGH